MESEGLVKPQTKKSLWKPEEDLILKTYIETHGEGNWAAVSKNSGLRRGGKSCRLRWKNYLRPDIKRGGMSKEEEDLIIRLHKLLGNRWSLIAGRLPGRTDNEVKNYWNARMSKRCRRRKDKTIHQESNKKIRPSNSEDTSCLPSSTSPAEAGLDVTKEGKEQSSDLAISWIDETQSFDCNLDIPIVPGNSAMFGFDDEPFMTDWDSFVFFEAEALGCGGLEYNSHMQWIMP